MKIGMFGDIHARDDIPDKRIDNYQESFDNKIHEALIWFLDNGVSLVLQPGDMFNTPKASNNLISHILGIITKYGIKWGVVYGQHDLHFHSLNVKNTPLNVLIKSQHMRRLLPYKPYKITKYTHVYGKSWGEDIQKPKDPKAINILVAHEMVVLNSKLWKDQQEYKTSSHLLTKYPYDLIVTGDNHKGFTKTKEDRFLVNCGSLMRSSSDQKLHEPRVYIYDTDEKSLKSKKLTIAPFHEVMDMDKIQEEKEKTNKKKASSFVLNVKKTYNGKVDFKKNIQEEATNKNIRTSVLTIIQEAMA